MSGPFFRVINKYFTSNGSDSQPYDARLNGNGWCPNNDTSNPAWLQVEFGTDVNITSMLIDVGVTSILINASMPNNSYRGNITVEYCSNNMCSGQFVR